MLNFREEIDIWLKQGNLVGINTEDFRQKINAYKNLVIKKKPDQPRSPQVLIAEANPENFLAALIAVLSCQGSVFLANPHWQQVEWQQVFELVKVDCVLGEIPELLINSCPTNSQIDSDHLKQSYFYIPTGGSSGEIKFATHCWETLSASVQGMQDYFQVEPIHSFCLLPLYHVSGLMQFLRSFISEGKLQLVSYNDLKKQPSKQDYSDYFISLVPTQLQFLLTHYPQWLAQFKTVLLGGAPAWPSLLHEARLSAINLAPTYGMTETASQIATLKPQHFAAQRTGVGQVLPQAKISIVDEQGESLNNQQVGLIKIESQSLFLGYYPEQRSQDYFLPGDLGYFDEQHFLHIMGRQNQQIISGGEKIFPKEVEAVILSSGWVTDVVVFGLADRHWGEVVVAIYVPKSTLFKLEELQTYLKQNLSAYKCPKYWQRCENIPRSPSGKINHTQLKAQFKAGP